jgi:hypothetical protein
MHHNLCYLSHIEYIQSTVWPEPTTKAWRIHTHYDVYLYLYYCYCCGVECCNVIFNIFNYKQEDESQRSSKQRQRKSSALSGTLHGLVWGCNTTNSNSTTYGIKYWYFPKIRVGGGGFGVVIIVFVVIGLIVIVLIVLAFFLFLVIVHSWFYCTYSSIFTISIAHISIHVSIHPGLCVCVITFFDEKLCHVSLLKTGYIDSRDDWVNSPILFAP